MEVALPIGCTLDPGPGRVQLVIVTKQARASSGSGPGPVPGSAVDALPIGLSDAQKAGTPRRYLRLPSMTICVDDGHDLSLDDAEHGDFVVDEVLWAAGTVGRFCLGTGVDRCRLHVTPALTSAVQCGALGRLIHGSCALKLGTMHVGRLAHLVSFVVDS
jgi:hypothetical protein